MMNSVLAEEEEEAAAALWVLRDRGKAWESVLRCESFLPGGVFLNYNLVFRSFVVSYPEQLQNNE